MPSNSGLDDLGFVPDPVQPTGQTAVATPAPSGLEDLGFQPASSGPTARPPLQVTAPSGRIYEWSGGQPPTDADWSAIQRYDSQAVPQERFQTPDALGFVPDTPQQVAQSQGIIPKGRNPSQANSRVMAGGPANSSMLPLVAGGINTVLTGGGAALGAAGGTVVAPGPGTVAGGVAGGMAGNVIAQKVNQALGLQKDFQWGQMAGAGIAGMVPGASLIEAEAGRLALEATKAAGANMAATAAHTVIDENRMPTASEFALAGTLGAAAPLVGKAMASGKTTIPEAAATQQLRNQLRDQSIAAAQADGYKFPASGLNPNSVTKSVEGFAGTNELRRQLTNHNQQVTNELAKADLGLPANAPITADAFKSVSDRANSTYNQIAQTSPEAGELLTFVQQARDKASDLWSSAKSPNGVNRTQLRQQAAKASAEASGWEQELQKNLTATGNEPLFGQYQNARTTLAKLAYYKGAWNRATGDVSAPDLGVQFDSGKPFTGGLASIANANLAMAKFTGEGVAQSGAAFGGGGEGALVGGLVGGVPGAVAGKVVSAVAGGAAAQRARDFVLSPYYQRTLARPNYGTPPADLPALLGKYSTMSAGRPANIPPTLQPEP